ncbi:MAG: hypothetical protein WC498_03365 [Candidatus Saccharimonadales bacterium]
MRRLLQLQHHKHTGKLLHHRHTSYRALLVILVVLGAVLVRVEMSLRQIAHADSFSVSAVVPAPIPTEPAVITQPNDSTTVTDPNLIIGGTCPDTTPPLTVAIYRGTELLGSAPCDTDGTFVVHVTLAPGNNALLPRTWTATDDSGPDGSIVHITYAPPAAATAGTPASLHPTATTFLTIVPDKPYLLFGPTMRTNWTGSIIGGKEPYTVFIDWGDGKSNTFKHIQSGQQSFTHQHNAHLAFYTIYIRATDETGAQASASISTITTYVAPATIGSIFSRPNTTAMSAYTLGAIYSAYIVMISTFGAFWIHAHKLEYAPASSKHRPVQRHRSLR